MMVFNGDRVINRWDARSKFVLIINGVNTFKMLL